MINTWKLNKKRTEDAECTETKPEEPAADAEEAEQASEQAVVAGGMCRLLITAGKQSH